MRILFIGTSDIRGGAAIVSHRLSKALELNYKHDVFFIVSEKSSQQSNVFECRSKFEKSIERIINKIFNIVGLQYKFIPFSRRNILRISKSIKPDVISLHNIHDGFFETSLLIELSKVAPIVWTLHDMWAFTRNAAHTFGNTSWRELKAGEGENKIRPTIGLNTGSWLLRQKGKIYRETNMIIVTPSMWLNKMANQSPVFRNKGVYHISNGVDVNIFKPADKHNSRKLLGLPTDGLFVIFTGDGLLKNNPWKGGKELIDVLLNVDSRINFEVNIILIGEGKIDELSALKNFKIHQMGYIKDIEKMKNCINAADILMYPTKADNLPNAVIEAAACGLPVVTFEVGGCPEIVKDSYSGYVIPPFDIEKFSERIIELLENAELRDQMAHNARSLAEEKFSETQMAESYFKIFKGFM
jgi:glycosyltransferase involved in cell wall biosynthesis